MKIEVNLLNDAFHMEAVNEDGARVHMDTGPDMGGVNGGLRPMQMLLAGLGGCSAIDVLDILRKQKQPVTGLSVQVEGERQKEVVPALWQKIHVHFTFKGQVEEAKAQRAVALSMDKYCSVAKTLEKTATITSSFEVTTGQETS